VVNSLLYTATLQLTYLFSLHDALPISENTRSTRLPRRSVSECSRPSRPGNVNPGALVPAGRPSRLIRLSVTARPAARAFSTAARSEERRVGKEGRIQRSPADLKTTLE